jgi:hypothetical protein
MSATLNSTTNSTTNSPTLVFVGSKNSPDEACILRFLNALREFFPQYTFQTKHFDSASALLKLLAVVEIPHVFIQLDSTSASYDSHSPEVMLQKLLRKYDKHLPLIKLVNEIPGGHLALQEIDNGVTAFLRRNFDLKDLDTQLREMLTLRFENHFLRLPRFEGTHKIKINIASMEQAIVSETLNLGRGGLFVRSVPEGMKVGDFVEFELNVNPLVSQGLGSEEDPITEKSRIFENTKDATSIKPLIRGNGVVVWVRIITNRPEQPEGFGMNFLNLDPASAAFVNQFVLSHGVKAYIPTA